MKNKRYVMGMVIVALVLFGISCGGGSSSPITTADNYNGSGITIDPTPTPAEEDGDEQGGNQGGEQGGEPEIQGNVVLDLDGDGIPNDEDPDADGDNFFTDSDDCNDLDASTYPDAPDKPEYPTYTDTNCDGVDGDIDNVYWVSSDGNDANPGTIDGPFRSIEHAAVIANADPLNLKDIYVAEGSYGGTVTITEGVGIYGGFGPLDANSHRPRDIGAYTTTHTNTMMPLVVFPSTSGLVTVIEGMELISAAEVPALVIINTSPVIRHNRIRAVDSQFRSQAVNVFSGGPMPPNQAPLETMPVFFGNTIEAGDCSRGDSYSVGIYAVGMGLDSHLELNLNGNTIISGLANRASVGVYTATNFFGYAKLVAQENNIEAGAGGALTAGIMLGRDLYGEMDMAMNAADIFRNRIHGGESATATYGVLIDKVSGGSVKLTNNFITGGDGAIQDAVGVAIARSAVEIKHNTINAGSSLADAIAIQLFKNVNVNIDNNILFAEDARSRTGINEKGPAATPTSLIANLFDDSLNVRYHDFVTGDILNIAAVNIMADIADDWGNLSGNAGPVDIAARDYHLLDTSDAIDATDESDVVEDIDGNARPAGETPDIGADEFVAAE